MLHGEAAGSDSMSDSGASAERGRDPWEWLQDAAEALGLPAAELAADRLRVDRRRLERLIQGSDDGRETAEEFFQRVMAETGTRVVWPTHLKIGSKSRKSPHVFVAGRPADVEAAKKLIAADLDSPDDRVTMKLDVSYLYHSHIIGRGGQLIKKVMEETGTHIHFPDSNRSSTTEKSSQVSLAGRLPGVEQARQRVRELMPLVFYFDVPAVGSLQPLPDAAEPFIADVQQQFHVQVRVRARHRLHSAQVQVKGCEWEVALVTEATLQLIEHLCHSSPNRLGGQQDQVSVYTTLEVSPHHQPVVLGAKCSNLKMIMSHTLTQIMVPDRNDPNIPSLKKNTVTITGPIRNVYLARQQLLGSLPILLMFEVSDQMEMDHDNISRIMQALDVHINFRYKEKQRTISLTVKGLERNATRVYEARGRLLGQEANRIVAKIPATYHIPDAPPIFSGARAGASVGGCGGRFLTPSPPLVSWLRADLLPLARGGSGDSSGYGSHSSLGSLGPGPGPGPGHSSVSGPGSDSNPGPGQGPGSASGSGSAFSARCSASSTASSLGASPSPSPAPSSDHSPPSSPDSSPPGSPVLSAQRKQLCAMPDSSGLSTSPVPCSNPGPSSVFPDLVHCPARRAPGYEKSLEMAASMSALDYTSKMMMAYKAMREQPVPSQPRVPTSAWAGYGFSQSETAAAAAAAAARAVPGDSAPPPEAYDINLWQSAPASLTAADLSAVQQFGGGPQKQPQDIVELLSSMGLQKYIGLFKNEEIDMQAFQSLTEQDLMQIGVTAIGARRKMITAINELKKYGNPFVKASKPSDDCKPPSYLHKDIW